MIVTAEAAGAQPTQNGVAESAGSQPFLANRRYLGSWETYDLVNNSDGTISLRSHANNRYVTAEAGGRRPLIANRTATGPWEKFRLIRL